MPQRLFLLLLLVLPAFARADDQKRRFYVEANLVSTLYHELGHALIHRMSLPVLGREEDAADSLAVLLVDAVNPPGQALAMARMQALGWKALADDNASEEIEHWGVHAHDRQRYYTHVCLWYGAAPGARRAFASEFGLPPDRSEVCAGEHGLAYRGWFGLLARARKQAPGNSLVFVGRADGYGAKAVLRGVRELNQYLSLGFSVTVAVESCGEANAFYQPDAARIIICTEYVDYLEGQAIRMNL